MEKVTGHEVKVAVKSVMGNMVAVTVGLVVPLVFGAVMGVGPASGATMSLTDHGPNAHSSTTTHLNGHHKAAH